MKNLFIVIVILTVGFLFYQSRIPHRLIGEYLSPSDNLTKADAIVVVSGSSERITHGVELYKNGLSSKLILSGAAEDGKSSNALAMKIEAEKQGVPDEAFLLEEKATNTYENAKFTQELINKKGYKNIILVTSPFHQRRVSETFQTVFKNSGVKFQNSPAEESAWKAGSWWTKEPEASLTRSEIIKLFWSKLTGNYQ